jgi:hypothetical protein
MAEGSYFKESPSGWQKSRDRIHRMETFAACMATGMLISEACAATGVCRATYHRWRASYPEFRSVIETLKANDLDGARPILEQWDGSFIGGRKLFFGYETYWHQREIEHAIEHAEPGEVVLILVAPETGKTTLLEDKMAIQLGAAPNTRITYVTESLLRTRKICGRLQRRMTNPHEYARYIEAFGPFYLSGQERQGKPWAADFFTVYRADHDERDYSFEGRGWRSAVAGTRTDKMFLDDVQSLRSLNQTDDIIERLRQDFFSRPGRDGVIVVTGTRVGIGDVYEEMWERGIVSERNIIRLPIMDADGESLCPELWPTEALSKKRALVGEDAWARNYMQKPRHTMDAAFTDAMIEGAWDDLRPLGCSALLDRVATLDPALAGGNALGVFAYDTEHLELVDFDYRFNVARVEDIVAGIERMADLYRFQDLVVETNAYQRGLVLDERLREVARRYGFRVHPHETHVNKVDADLGVARMPTAFIKGEIRLPGDTAARDKLRPYLDQHLGWRANIPTRRRTQDLVMMQWFAWLFWERRRKVMGNVSSFSHIRKAAPFRVRSAPLYGKVRRAVG